MTLTPVLITVEADQWDAMPHGRRSELIREFIRNYNFVQEANLKDVNLELLKVEVTTLRNAKTKIDTELQTKQAMLDKAMILVEEEHKKQLEQIKQKVEDANKCICCKKILSAKEKRQKFAAGFVCNSCFMSNATKENILKWSMEAV